MADEPYIDEHPDHARARRLTRRALFLALFPLLTFGSCTVAISEGEDFFMAAFGLWALSCVGAIVGGFMALKANRLRKSKRRKTIAIVAFLMPIITTVLGFLVGLTYLPFQRGRAFRRRGRPRLPEAAPNDHWSASAPAPIETSEDREAIAAGWRAMAATETASIASFASLSSQLLAVGAPSTLIELAHRDAIDEIEHARLCYDVARDLDGRTLGAGAFPAATLPPDRQPTLASLALECLRESCVLEAASAKAAAALAERAGSEPIAEVLRAIATDEARHADHGWRMLEWLQGALDEDDPGFARELAKLRGSVPRAVVEHDRFEAHGLAGPALWERAVHDAIAEAEERLHARRSTARAA